MANKIVQPQEKNADGTYDNLIMQEAVNAVNATNAEKAVKNSDGTYSGITKGSDGILRIGDIIIPQRKLLWSNESGASSATWSEELKEGDTVEITYSLWLNRQIVKGTLYKESNNQVGTELYIRTDYGFFTTTNAYQTAYINVNTTSSNIRTLSHGNHDSPATPLMYKIVKVIE